MAWPRISSARPASGLMRRPRLELAAEPAVAGAVIPMDISVVEATISLLLILNLSFGWLATFLHMTDVLCPISTHRMKSFRLGK